jgi:hypothetical protein
MPKYTGVKNSGAPKIIGVKNIYTKFVGVKK